MSKGKILNEKTVFGIYIVGFVVLVLSLAMMQPLKDSAPYMGNPPDEHARFLVPQYICKYGKLPTGLEEEVRIPGYGFSYGLYNVFPYIIQGYLMRLVNIFTDSQLLLLFAARFVNVIFGVLMAIVVWLIGKRVFSDSGFRWLFCFATVFFPQNIFVHSYVNTDSCCMLSAAMILYGLLLIYQNGIDLKNCLWLSGGIILCALSYYNAYGYILSSIILFFAYFCFKRNGRLQYDWKNMLRTGSFISVIVLGGIAWWFIRSYIVLDGDALGLRTREELGIQYAIEEVNPLYVSTYKNQGRSIWDMLCEEDMLDVAYHSFVAAYGSMSVYGSMWMYRAYGLFFGVGAIGLLCWLYKGKAFRNMKAKKIFFHLNMIFCMVMPFFLMVYYSYAVDYQPQGRYILPALLPIIYYTVKGIEGLAEIAKKCFGVPDWFIRLGIICCFLFVTAGAVDMIYFQAVPIYMKASVWKELL